MSWFLGIVGCLCFFAFLAWVRSNVVIGLSMPDPTDSKCPQAEDHKHDFTNWFIRGDGLYQYDYRRCRKCDAIETRELEVYVGVKTKRKEDQHV